MRGGARRAYGDFRDNADVGGKREPLIPVGERRGVADPEFAQTRSGDTQVTPPDDRDARAHPSSLRASHTEETVNHSALLALVALFTLLSIPLQAQSEVLPAGTRVRIWPACPAPSESSAKPCAPVVGRLLRIDTAGVLMQRGGAPPETLPLGSSTRLEVSEGSRHHTLLGLGAGAVVGFGTGMILASRAGCDSGIFGSAEREDDLCGAYGVALPVGAVLGAVVGRLIRSERWRPTGMNKAALRLVPSRERVSLSIGLAF